MLTTDDERWGNMAHRIRQSVPDGSPPYRDNAYQSFWDSTNDVYGAFHVSTSPNAEGRRARFSVSIDGHRHELIEPLLPGTWTSHSIEFRGGSSIRIRSEDISADLELAPLFAIADYTAAQVIPELVPGEPLHHFEQLTSVRGTIQIRGRSESAVEARGLRDRSWGFRDEAASIDEYLAISATFDDYGLTVLRFVAPNGTDRVDGHVFRGNEIAATVRSVDVTRSGTGLLHSCRVRLSNGNDLDLLAGRELAGFWIPMGTVRSGPTMSAYDEFIQFTTSDGRYGHGLAEHGIVRKLF